MIAGKRAHLKPRGIGQKERDPLVPRIEVGRIAHAERRGTEVEPSLRRVGIDEIRVEPVIQVAGL